MIYYSPEIVTVQQNQFVPSAQGQYFQFGEDIIGFGEKVVAPSDSCVYTIGVVLDLTTVVSIEDDHGTVQFISTAFDLGSSNVIPVTAEVNGDQITLSFGAGQAYSGTFGPCDITGTITGELIVDKSTNPATMSGPIIINVTSSPNGGCSLQDGGLPCNLALQIS